VADAVRDLRKTLRDWAALGKVKVSLPKVWSAHNGGTGGCDEGSNRLTRIFREKALGNMENCIKMCAKMFN
jgi:hypothetical protein